MIAARFSFPRQLHERKFERDAFGVLFLSRGEPPAYTEVALVFFNEGGGGGVTAV